MGVVWAMSQGRTRELVWLGAWGELAGRWEWLGSRLDGVRSAGVFGVSVERLERSRGGSNRISV